MLVLALDTTTRAGSAALVRDGAVLLEHTGDPALTHGQRLPRDLMALLERARVRLDQIELLAVVAGPGSFTGLRVGIATVQGLAMATNLSVVPVSALEALARAAGGRAGPVAPWIDAQRGEVFAALYSSNGESTILTASSEPPQRTLERWMPHLGDAREHFIGDGAVRYREVIARLRPFATIAEDVPSLAGIAGAIAALHPERAVLPHAIVPIYIRRSDAELARDRKWSS